MFKRKKSTYLSLHLYFSDLKYVKWSKAQGNIHTNFISFEY